MGKQCCVVREVLTVFSVKHYKAWNAGLSIGNYPGNQTVNCKIIRKGGLSIVIFQKEMFHTFCLVCGKRVQCYMMNTAEYAFLHVGIFLPQFL